MQRCSQKNRQLAVKSPSAFFRIAHSFRIHFRFPIATLSPIILYFTATSLLMGCGLPSQSGSGANTRATLSVLDLGASELSVLMGEHYTLSVPGGNSVYQWTDTNAWIDLSSGLLSIPLAAIPQTETIYVKDRLGKFGSLNLHVRGFQTKDNYAVTPSLIDDSIPGDCTADSLGNVFVAGYKTDGDSVAHGILRKMNGSTWSTVNVDPITRYSSVFRQIAVAANDDVYIAGAIVESGMQYWATYKSADHGSTWTVVDKTIGSGVNSAAAVAIATVGGVQNIFVAGTSASIFTVRRSQDGGATWSSVYTSSGTVFSNAYAVTADSSGGVYVTGSRYDYRNQYRLVLAHSTDTGATWGEYDYQYGGTSSFPYPIAGEAVVSDGSGNVFVGGYGTDSSSHYHAIVLKSTDSGVSFTPIEDSSDYPTASQNYSALVFDSSNNLLVLGTLHDSGNVLQWAVKRKPFGSDTFAPLSTVISAFAGSRLCRTAANSYLTIGSNQGGRPFAWKTFASTDNAETWVASDTITSKSPSLTKATGVVTDSSGVNIAVGYGSSTPAAFTRWLTRRSGDQGMTWAAQDDFQYSAANSSRALGAAAIKSGAFAGKIFVAGYGMDASDASHWLVRVSSDHGASWGSADIDSRTSTVKANAVEFDPVHNLIYVVGTYIDISNNGRWLVKASADGGVTWTDADDFRYLGTSTSTVAQAISMDSNGAVYITGAGLDASGYSHLLTRKSTDGGVTWSTIDDFQPTVTSVASGGSIAIDSTNQVYVAGMDGTHAFMRKSDTSGTGWTTLSMFDGGESLLAAPISPKVLIADDGALYVALIRNPNLSIYRSRDGGASFALVDDSLSTSMGSPGALGQCASNRICALLNAPEWTTRTLSP